LHIKFTEEGLFFQPRFDFKKALVSLVEQAIRTALELGATHLAGVQFCLQQLLQAPQLPPALEGSLPTNLAAVGKQPIDLRQYDQLLGGR